MKKVHIISIGGAVMHNIAIQLASNSRSASGGDRYFVVSAFREAFSHVIPGNTMLKTEVEIGNYLSKRYSKKCSNLIKRKRIDFVIERPGYGVQFVEFKSNLTFNDLAAAMVEMQIIKKFVLNSKNRRIHTASLHLFPGRTNVAALREFNKVMGLPIDDIWVFCTGPKVAFDIKEIKGFRSSIASL